MTQQFGNKIGLQILIARYLLAEHNSPESVLFSAEINRRIHSTGPLVLPYDDDKNILIVPTLTKTGIKGWQALYQPTLSDITNAVNDWKKRHSNDYR